MIRRIIERLGSSPIYVGLAGGKVFYYFRVLDWKSLILLVTQASLRRKVFCP